MSKKGIIAKQDALIAILVIDFFVVPTVMEEFLFLVTTRKNLSGINRDIQDGQDKKGRMFNSSPNPCLVTLE